MIYGVIAFESTHDAIAAQKDLKGLLPVVVMPTPRCITASCGISLRFSLDDTPVALDAVQGMRGCHLYRVGDGVCEPFS